MRQTEPCQQDEGNAWLCLKRLQHMSEHASATAAGAISARSRGRRFGFVLGHQAGFRKVTVPCFHGDGSRGSLRNLNGSQFLHLSEGRKLQWTRRDHSLPIRAPIRAKRANRLAQAVDLGHCTKWFGSFDS